MGPEQGQDKVATREPQVPRDLMQLERTVDGLGKDLEALVNRLDSVLRAPTPPTPKKDSIEPISLVCPLAQMIQGVTARAASIRQVVQDATQRLEV